MNIRGEYWWLRLHAQGIDWAQCHADEPVPRQEGTCADIRSLPAPSGARLVVYVPGDRARMHRVSLPHRNRRKFLDALPYALEDQLLHDPASYHLLPLHTDKHALDVPVIVIEHEYLSSLLEQCSQSGWQPVMLVPDYMGIAPPATGTWFIEASTTPLLLRMPGQQGAVLHGEPGPLTIGTLLLALEQSAVAPHILRVRVATPQQYKMISAWSEVLAGRNIQLDLYLDEHTRSGWLARQPLPDHGLNMLTGIHTGTDRQGVFPRCFLPAAALAAALLIIATAHWLINGMQLQTQYDQLQQSIEATYLQAFPGARNLVAPRFQMEQQIKDMQTRGDRDSADMDFLVRLEKLAGLLAAQADCQLQRLGFDGSNITLEISVADYESLDRLQVDLARLAKVQIENAELKNGRVYSRILLGGRA